MAREIYMRSHNYGLKLSPPEPDEWTLGSGLASKRFGAVPLNPTGDWEPWKPADEHQSIPGFDTQGCANFGTLKAYITLAKFLGFEFPPDASERYTGAHAGTDERGTDPHLVAESMRKVGLIDQKLMPWTDDIDTFEEYYDKRMAQSLVPIGRKLAENYELGHEWVIPFGSHYTPEQKQVRLQEALKRGPVCVSVDGSYRKKGKFYFKEPGTADTHWVEMLKHDGVHGGIHDQYAPFLKTLATNYDHDAAKVYFLKRKEPVGTGFWDRVFARFASLWKSS